ncbi:MAG: CHAT domain-containing tetratricopeptide repeat protein [Acidobacteriaceae bacterium]
MKLRSNGLVRVALHPRTCLSLAAVLGLITMTAGAQTPACAPAASHEYRGLEPAMPPPFADASILPGLQQGYRLLYSSHPDALKTAQSKLLQALASSTAVNNRCGEALAEYALGNIANRTEFGQAESWFDKAAAAFAAVPSPLGLADTHFSLASVHSTQGHEKQSLQEYSAAALELERAGDPVEAISARVGALGYSVYHPQEYAALQQQAHALGDPCEEADVLRLWGDHAQQAAQYQDAMDHYQFADRLFALCPGGASQRGALQTSMGRLERKQGRPAMALPHYRLALRFQRQTGDPSYIPQTYNAMAVAYEAMGDIPRAILLYKRGLEEANTLHSQPFIDFLSANLGATYANTGHPLLGIPLLEAATQHLTSDYLICIRDDQLGNAYRDARRLHEAANRLDIAVATCQREDAKSALAGALVDRAMIEMKSNRMDAAWADANKALGMVEEFRAHLVQADAYKRGYISAKQTRSTYDLAITILMRMKRYQQALEVAEQGRARALLDLLASEQDVSVYASTPGSAESLIASPVHTGAFTFPQMLDEAVRLHTTILAYWMTDSALYTWVEQPGKPVLGVAQTIKPLAIERLIQSSLPQDSAMGESPGSIKGPKTNFRPDLQYKEKLQAIVTRGQSTSRRAYSLTPWKRLYSLLIAPVASALPQDDDSLLTIVPSGPLFRVSFAALVDPHGHYLVERYRTDTIPMVGLLKYTESNSATAESHPAHYLFVAAPNNLPPGPDGQPLPTLPGTVHEVHAIAALLPSSDVTVLTGDEALRLRVEDEATEATYLHFATHAIVNSEYPQKTYLALDNAQGEGRLTLGDIYGLHLHARLVVLSACRTGLGKISGDGVAGLSRAFFYAGAASVLTTLWDIADRPTSVMLPRFYTALLQNQAPSEALRTAQLSILDDLRHRRLHVETLRGSITLPPSPVYWAGFALSGEP